MADFALKHHKHPAHYSCVATGMSVSGPTPDGFVHVTFYRDRIDLVEELFETADGSEVPESGPVTLKKKDPATKSDISREDVVTVLIPSQVFASFSTAFTDMTKNLADQKIIEVP